MSDRIKFSIEKKLTGSRPTSRLRIMVPNRTLERALGRAEDLERVIGGLASRKALRVAQDAPDEPWDLGINSRAISRNGLVRKRNTLRDINYVLGAVVSEAPDEEADPRLKLVKYAPRPYSDRFDYQAWVRIPSPEGYEALAAATQAQMLEMTRNISFHPGISAQLYNPAITAEVDWDYGVQLHVGPRATVYTATNTYMPGRPEIDLVGCQLDQYAEPITALVAAVRLAEGLPAAA